ncbi:hypothetical protein ABPG72_011023 [Tetrahymena utriculariae]
MKIAFAFLFFIAQKVFSLHLFGTDTSLSENPIRGPGGRTVSIEFKVQFPPHVTPYILISYSKFHFSMAKINHYKATVVGVTNKGFSIIYETETQNMEFGADVEWLAFDDTSDFFGEVQYIEEYDTGFLKEFYKTGDEHRMQLKDIKFQRTYLRTPGVAIFVVGASNDGIERLVSANYTDASPFSFTMQVLAWHHTELTYYKFAILTYYKDECLQKTGRQYVWNEEHHKFKPHPWNQIHLFSDNDFRHMHYDFPIEHENSKNFRPDFIYSGFVGYDIKNYQQNYAEFNLALKNVEVTKKEIKMDVGTWNKTQVAGAQWNYIVCETNGDFVSQRKLTLIQKIVIGVAILAMLITFVILLLKIPKMLQKQKKVKEL